MNLSNELLNLANKHQLHVCHSVKLQPQIIFKKPQEKYIVSKLQFHKIGIALHEAEYMYVGSDDNTPALPC